MVQHFAQHSEPVPSPQRSIHHGSRTCRPAGPWATGLVVPRRSSPCAATQPITSDLGVLRAMAVGPVGRWPLLPGPVTGSSLSPPLPSGVACPCCSCSQTRRSRVGKFTRANVPISRSRTGLNGRVEGRPKSLPHPNQSFRETTPLLCNLISARISRVGTQPAEAETETETERERESLPTYWVVTDSKSAHRRPPDQGGSAAAGHAWRPP
jgi:hypothetical protein